MSEANLASLIAEVREALGVTARKPRFIRTAHRFGYAFSGEAVEEGVAVSEPNRQAGLGVPAFMVSGNVSRANYSSLRAALITFKANLEAIQHNVLVPQLLAPIWRR